MVKITWKRVFPEYGPPILRGYLNGKILIFSIESSMTERGVYKTLSFLPNLDTVSYKSESQEDCMLKCESLFEGWLKNADLRHRE